MVRAIRSFARRTLRDQVRKPLGSIPGLFEHHVARAIEHVSDLEGRGVSRWRLRCRYPDPSYDPFLRACFLRGDHEEGERESNKSCCRRIQFSKLGTCLHHEIPFAQQDAPRCGRNQSQGRPVSIATARLAT